MLSHAEFTGKFSYNAETGEFFRRATNKRVGTINRSGYVVIWCDGKLHYAHRLAWFYMTGIFPKSCIDHVNGVRSNNSFGNLREATYQQNQGNRKCRRDCGSGFKGVRFHRASGMWFASIVVDRRVISLGYHKSPEAAASAYNVAAPKYFGEFARPN